MWLTWLAMEAADGDAVGEHAVENLVAPRQIDKGGDGRARIGLAVCDVETKRQQCLREQAVDDANASVVCI